MRVPLLLLVILALAAPSVASATQPDVASLFEREAVQVWGGPAHALPPCGQIHLAWVDEFTDPIDGAIGMAFPATCVIEFDTAFWNGGMPGASDTPTSFSKDLGDWCVVVLHEVGHLYEQQHRPRGVMNPTFGRTRWQDVPGCRRLLMTRPQDMSCASFTIDGQRAAVPSCPRLVVLRPGAAA